MRHWFHESIMSQVISILSSDIVEQGITICGNADASKPITRPGT
jgi:hypothetical protein